MEAVVLATGAFFAQAIKKVQTISIPHKTTNTDFLIIPPKKSLCDNSIQPFNSKNQEM
jgi:hypothetical protein